MKSISKTDKKAIAPSSIQFEHPYKGLMQGQPGVVGMYLIDWSQRIYVDVYAANPDRLNVQANELIGKRYDWPGIAPEILEPRLKAIYKLLADDEDDLSYSYTYDDRGTQWEFNVTVSRLPPDYILLMVADGYDWQPGYWTARELKKSRKTSKKLRENLNILPQGLSD